MRKIIVEAEISVDGAMGGENAAFWNQVFPFHSADVTEYLNDLMFMPDALLLGKRTYEGFAQVWPTRHPSRLSLRPSEMNASPPVTSATP